LRPDQALFLDFDGTLVEIARAPGLVRVPPRLPRFLDELTGWLDGAFAVVSGRPLDELAQMIAPFSGQIAGQHGLERRRGDGSVIRCATPPELSQARLALIEFAARHDGVMLEDKGCILALHYRQAPTLGPLCDALVRRIAHQSSRLEAVAGKMVIELIPQSGGKGSAITSLLAEAPFRERMPVFVGDDTADEGGFAVVNRLGGVSVHVGAGATVAHHRLATVGEVLAWLARGFEQ
jgi:trehalose 6-phosphate phosphatase